MATKTNDVKPADTKGLTLDQFLQQIGSGIGVHHTDTHLFFAVPIAPDDLAKARPSASGKTLTVATTGGLARIPGQPRLRANVTVSADPIT